MKSKNVTFGQKTWQYNNLIEHLITKFKQLRTLLSNAFKQWLVLKKTLIYKKIQYQKILMIVMLFISNNACLFQQTCRLVMVVENYCNIFGAGWRTGVLYPWIQSSTLVLEASYITD